MNHKIFALELCMRLEPESRLLTGLRELLATHPALSSPGPKWELFKRITELLVEHQALFEKGCWDFFDDNARALADYEMWSNGMITEEGVRKQQSGSPGDNDARYMTFTISFLLKAESQSAEALARLCMIPQADLWKKSSFVRILRGLSRVSFASVKSDCIYLIPRDDDWGLTRQDLAEPKFHYLRPIEA